LEQRVVGENLLRGESGGGEPAQRREWWRKNEERVVEKE
jgi:hypothetical protein